MANQQNSYTGSDVDANNELDFTFPSYTTSEVKVEVDNVVKTLTTHYTVENYNTESGGKVRFTTGNIPTGTTTVRIFRQTDIDNSKAIFTAGSSLKAGELNENFKQLRHAAQEAIGANATDRKVQTFNIEDDAITADKLADLSVSNANVTANAAIDGTKISPDFGLQNIVTTGQFQSTGSGTSSGLKINNAHDSVYQFFQNNNNNSDFYISYSGSGGPEIKLGHDGKVSLSHAGTTRIQTTTVGASITGNLGITGTVDGVDIAARDTLFGALTSSSGVLTNGVTATTQSASDNSTKIATTAYVDNASGSTLTTEEVQDIVGGMVSGNTETNIAVTYDDTNGKLNFASTDTDTNTQLTNEQVQDIVGGMVSGNTETNIAVTYDDANGKLNFSSTDTDTVYTDSDVDAHLNRTSSVSTGLVLAWNGSDYSWTTRSTFTTEDVQDIVGGMVSGNTETNIAVTYDDANGKLNFASTDTNTVYANSDVDTHLNQSSAGNNEVLSWNGSDYAWVAQSGGVALTDLSVTTTSASGGGSLSYNNSTGVFTFAPSTNSGGGGISNVVEDTTPQLGGDLDVNGHDIILENQNEIIFKRDGTTKLEIKTMNGNQQFSAGSNGVEFNVAALGDSAFKINDTSGSGSFGSHTYFKLNRTEALFGVSPKPKTDDSIDLGSGSLMWDNVYSTGGIQSASDERLKQDIQALTTAEKAVASTLKGLIKTFKYKKAVAAKGDKARIHCGVIAQEVKAAFEAQGLKAEDYGLFCYDEWDAIPEEKDEDGNITKLAVPAGNRYSIRYTELLAFIISAL